MLQALGATSDPWLLQRYLLRSLDRHKVRPQDVETVIGSVASNPEGQFLAWRHLKAYFNSSSVQVSEFFKKVDVGNGKRALEQSVSPHARKSSAK